jgi:trk system potassium uptake protein TrkH
VSFATSTGFTTLDHSQWPGFLPVLLVISAAFGSCAGSTGGGIKVIRCLVLFKHSVREVMRTVHPNAEIPVKIGDRVIPVSVIEAVCGFFAAYVVLFVAMWLALMSMGLDAVTAFSAVSACMNNMGPGLGQVAANFTTVAAGPKWVLIFAMLLGRLEIFTLLAVLTPAFWRR